jgi:3-deoxy-manno-octulosonate cytidylyltransferase (CMP-KDO synthetase)
MSAVGIIPARYASTRFPGKPLAEIAGRPMIHHVYERACRASSLAEVLVATDDQRIFDAVLGFGGEAIMTSAYHPTGTDRIAEVVERLSAMEIIVNIQGDEPLIEPEAIDEVAAGLQDDRDAAMCSVMTPLADAVAARDPNLVKVVCDLNGYALYFSRAPIPGLPMGVTPEVAPWKRHVGLYAYRRDFLLAFTRLRPSPLEKLERLEQLRALENGYRIKMIERAQDFSFGVDTPADLERVREMVEGQLAKE